MFCTRISLRAVSLIVLTAISVVMLGAAGVARGEDKPAPRVDRLGDPLPEGAVSRLGTQRWRHDGNVSFIAYADGGKQVLTSCGDGVVYVWEAQSGKPIRTFGKKVTVAPK